MASLGIAVNADFRGSVLSNSLSTRSRSSSPEAQAIRFSPLTSYMPNRSSCSLRNSRRSDRQVLANAKQCVERNAETASNGVNHVNGTRSFPKFLESEIAVVEHCQELLKRSGLADLRAREAFVMTGDITEADMETLVESLAHEEGQSMEDYRQRAIMFDKIAEFFSLGRTYSTPKEESWTGATEIARTMQVIVDVVLAGEGRSATDYNCRAQLFAKSAEVFPFIAEVRSS